MSQDNESPLSKRRCLDHPCDNVNTDATTSTLASSQSEQPGTSETPHTSDSGPSQTQGAQLPDTEIAVQVTDQGPRGPAHDGSQTEDGSVYLEHISHRERNLTKFNGVKHTHTFRFVNLDRIQTFAEALSAVQSTIQTLLNESMVEVEAGDFIQLGLDGGETLHVVFSKKQAKELFNAETFLENIANALQSNAECLSNNCLKLTVMVFRNKRGGARKPLKSIPYSEIITEKKRWLYNFDDPTSKMCLAASLYALMDLPNEIGILEQAKRLHRDLGIPEDQMVSFSHIEKFEEYLNVTIKVVYKSQDRWQFYETRSHSQEKTFYILHHNDHYYGIKNVKSFLGEPYFCERCNSVYHRKNAHSCPYCCRACRRDDCVEVKGPTLRCQRCRVFCRSEKCLEEHGRLATADGSMCVEKSYCKKCHRFVTNIKEHECNGLRCDVCGARIDDTKKHLCYMQPYKPPEETTKYIIYDFECMQETGTHIPNYIYAKGLSDPSDWEFRGATCVQDFVKCFIKTKFKDYTFIAHNAGRYDSYFILSQLIKEKMKVQVVNQGGRLLGVTLPDLNIRFIDSLNFLPMKLSKLPQAMGFSGSKGFFPHFFNTESNQNYVGAMPGLEHYGMDNMMPGEKAELSAWYEEHKQDRFHFQEELKAYCKKDVDVLREACQMYRDAIIEMTKKEVKVNRRRKGKKSEEVSETRAIDPFQRLTLASVCMAMYQFTSLPPDTIAILPADNYQKTQKRFSTPSIQWLMYVEHTEKIYIRHALKGGEKNVGKYFLDGHAFVKGRDIAFEFLGCFYHGCPDCYKRDDLNEGTKFTYDQRYHRFLDKKSFLEGLDYVVRILWEHEWNEMLKKDKSLQKFLLEKELPEPLDPRDALYGGRTNAIKFYHKAEEDETIKYYDFTSLYPFINKTKAYPKGHPKIIYKDFGSIEQYFGIAKVKVNPPRRLFFPVLPVKLNNKLLFPLCYTCASDSQPEPCTHSDEERSLTGTWCTVELKLAVEKGYKIVQIYEVWHFPDTTEDLFAPYVKQHLRYKQEASGYPSGCTDDAKKKEFIDSFYKREDVQLCAEDIKVNPSKRQISKLFLNSLWGKFGQRTDLPHTSIVTDPDEHFRLMFSPCVEISEVNIINDETTIVNWKHAKGHHKANKNTNIFIACFTTAHARLELYKLLDGLQERCFYHDTDSVIFVSKKGDWDPPLGYYLGELTSEVPDGTHITEFVSAGPKSYGYKLNTGETVLKVKGITLNVANRQVINFESLKDLVLDYSENSDPQTQRSIGVEQSSIVRDRKSWQIETRVQRKTQRCVYTKRQLAPDFTTLPYGY
ncbi:uncharacterized protein LOC120921636 [Rana temporaria]|uniref:uncharacterized protein LOC120921636 n=1 Tax=Rana temporaria TaxID=8407 RepID=UPI001AAD4681|nr:uncharacterized protein LOC120921636 [Rana temporaria]